MFNAELENATPAEIVEWLSYAIDKDLEYEKCILDENSVRYYFATEGDGKGKSFVICFADANLDGNESDPTEIFRITVEKIWDGSEKPIEVSTPNEGTEISTLSVARLDDIEARWEDTTLPLITVNPRDISRHNAEAIAHAPQDVAALLKVARAAERYEMYLQALAQSPPRTTPTHGDEARHQLRAALRELEETP